MANLMGAGSAQAGLFDDEEARKAILELRQKVESNRADNERRINEIAEALNQARRAAGEDGTTARRSLLDLQAQIDALKAEIAGLRGQNEQLARQNAELQRQTRDAAAAAVAVDERMRRFEPIKVAVDGKEFVADPAEKRDFDAALAVFRKGEFAQAQTAFVGFAQRFPASGYMPSALFWLGNAQYATRDYKEAIVNFRALLQQAPDHTRAPEAALSIANCQVELKDLRGARKTLEDLQKAYPQSEAASAAKERLAKLR